MKKLALALLAVSVAAPVLAADPATAPKKEAAMAAAPSAGTVPCPTTGGKVELKNGMWAFGDKEWKAGTAIWSSKDGKDCMVAPNGEHETKDGKKIHVKDGKITG